VTVYTGRNKLSPINQEGHQHFIDLPAPRLQASDAPEAQLKHRRDKLDDSQATSPRSAA
jgi:hypothetical protein